MKHMRIFKDTTEYQAFTGGEYITPNMCLIEDSFGLICKPEVKVIIPNIIIFTVDGIEYQAEEGMTWKEWCNSEYNTAGFIYDLTENGYGIYTSDYEKYFIFGLYENSLVTTGQYVTKMVDWPLI